MQRSGFGAPGDCAMTRVGMDSRHVWIVEDLRPYPYDWEVDGE